MCIEAMDSRLKHVKSNCLRKTAKLGSKLGWRLLRVTAEGDEALKECRVRATTRKERKRTQMAKLAKLLKNIEETERGEFVYEESPAVVCVRRHSAGAMAPENTTQYLMSQVYEDMKTDSKWSLPAQTSSHLYGESLSPSGVYTALDSGFDDCLDFQHKDFEEAYELSW